MQVTVEPTALQQFRMGSDLGQSALVEHQNLIGMLDRGETVRDDQGGPVRYEVGQGILHQTLGLIVERRCGLIQNQDRRIFQDRAGNGKTLFLPAAEAAATLPDCGIHAVRELEYEFLGIGRTQRIPDFGITGARLAEAHVGHD